MNICCFHEEDRNNSVNHESLEINNAESNENIITDIVTEVAKAAFTYIQETFPTWIFHAIHITCPALIGNITHKGYSLLISPLTIALLLCRSENLDATESFFLTLQIVSVAAIVAELSLNILFPPNLYVHLAVKGIMLFSGVATNARSIWQGTHKIHQGLTDAQLETSKKVVDVASGFISLSLGLFGIFTVFETAKKLNTGLQVYQKLDQNQQMFTLKYHALESIGEVKQKNAVIINGLSSKWAEEVNHYFDDTPSSASYVIYQNYNTRTYEVKSAHELSHVLEQASKELGEKFDLIAFMGHANNQEIRLNENYNFRGTRLEIQSIRKQIADAGELLLFGCETARPDATGQSLVQKISKLIPKVSVTGFAELLYPRFSWFWFDKKIQAMAWKPGSFIGGSFAKVYKKGQVAYTEVNSKIGISV